MTLDVNQARQQFSAWLPPAVANGGKAGSNDGVTFTASKTDGWGAALRFLAKIAVLPWAIAKAVGATERRVLMHVNDRSIDTGVTKNEFKKLSASPKGADGQRSQAQDRQVRSIATKLIKAGGEAAQLNQVLKGCSTDDLVALGRDCANDPTGAFRQKLFVYAPPKHAQD